MGIDGRENREAMEGYKKTAEAIDASESIAKAVETAENIEQKIEGFEKTAEAVGNIDKKAITDVTESGGKEKKEEKRKRKKAEKPKKTRRGLRTFLRILQHAALAAMVFSLIVTVACGTVRFQGLRSGGSFTDLAFSMNAGKYFEDSAVFHRILGYATADIIRYGVVCSQMETDGAFDGEKLVDVTAYNHRSEGLTGEYVTAVYKLEDLLKWQKYGFEFSVKDMTEAQAEDFLAKIPQVTVKEMAADTEVKPNVQYRIEDSDSGFVTDYQPASALAEHAYANIEIEQEIEVINPYVDEVEEYNSYSVLVNRYQTAEGKNIEDYVSDWEQYYALCDNVQAAAESLAYNYEEYVTGKEYFDLQNSNVRFLIEKKEGRNKKYYSNTMAGSKERDEIERLMEKVSREGDGVPLAERYLYYSPADMVYRTNTSIAESTVEQVLQQYAYAYPEDVKVWISVNPSYSAMDAFKQGAEYMPNLWQWAMTALFSGLLYLALFVWQTMMTGREYDEDGMKRIRLDAFDTIPTEGALLIAAGVFLLTGWVSVVATEIAGIDPTSLDFYRDAVRWDWFIALVLIGTFVADVIFTFFFYSLVRRIKAHTLFGNSYLRRILCRLKDFAWKVYDNGGIVLRTWVPYGIFLLFNLLMLVVFIAAGEMGGDLLMLLLFLFTCVVDVAVGMMLYRDAKERQGIAEGIEIIAGGHVDHQLATEGLHGDNKTLARSVNSIGKGIKEAVEISMKDERMKADLITNVSHDIKTPLTSIINYVDLLKREQVGSEKAKDYIRVLDEKSQRLKQLTDDLVEASKISSGTISLHFERINLTELMNQTIGEFSEKFEEKNLVTVMNVNTGNTVVEADSRRIWRVMENLFNNVYKYAMPGTRVYVSMDQVGKEERIQVSIKNISENYLNCKPEELTERFIRGDESRTTEGSGLGLSIAKNLTLAQGGTFEIELDGDLFKVFMTFPLAAEEG